MAHLRAFAAAPPRPHRPSRVPAVVAGALAVGLACGSIGCGQPAPPTPRQPDAATVAAAITEDGLRDRLRALAAATAGSDQYRAVGSDGYDRAATMVEGALRNAGWTVTADAYDGLAFEDEGASSVEVGGRTFGKEDLLPLVFAPAGDVVGPVVPIDWNPAATGADGKGCAVTHYGDLPANAIVIVRSGDCLRRDQVIAAQQAGAAAFVAVYPWAPPGAVYRPTLIEPRFLTIPAAGVSGEAAEALVAAAGAGETAHLVTRVRTRQVPTRSIIAELPGTEPGVVIMLGAHLDSVLDGPGLNDDASGVAALLEIGTALAGTRPRATIRLAFWSGEELGLHGSYRYATALSSEDARAILVYANVDMIASPNGFAGVYDESGAPVGSAAARDLLTSAVERAGGTPFGIDLGGGSDHRGFAESGVATAGVYSGAGEPVTAEQAAPSAEQSTGSGAVAGRPADACYHQPCDDLENANLRLARVLAAGLADFTVRVANNPELLAH
jgi:Zn-dependent M28 family amino/carboxypeptidase